jgi:cyclopropane fatty-acyl-phospholipid synthase-like methyltransferase
VDDPNLTWRATDPSEQLLVVAGTAFGTDLETALEGLREFKQFEASVAAVDLDLAAGDVVAEIGSGYGYWASATSSLVSRVICLDISPDLLELCRKEVAGRGNVECRLIEPGDLSTLRRSGVTKVYAAGVFIHFNLYDIIWYLRQIFEVLPPGGRVMFNIANSDCAGLFQFDQFQLALDWYRDSKLRLFSLMYFNSPVTVVQIAETIGFRLRRTRDPREQYVWFVFEKPAARKKGGAPGRALRGRLADRIRRLEYRVRFRIRKRLGGADRASEERIRTERATGARPAATGQSEPRNAQRSSIAPSCVGAQGGPLYSRWHTRSTPTPRAWDTRDSQVSATSAVSTADPG